MKLKFILAIIVLLTGCFMGDKESYTKFSKLPSLKLLSLDSTPLYTDSLKLNGPIALIYISTGCPHCSLQINKIKTSSESLGNIQFLVITNRPLYALRRFYKDNKLAEYKNILVAHDYQSTCFSAFQIEAVPFIAIFDDKRKIITSKIGVLESKEIEKITKIR